MIILVILIILYVIITKLAYNDIRATYSKGGRYEGLTPTSEDLFFVFMPLFQIFLASEYVTGTCYRDKNRNILNKFFKINK